MRWPSRVHGWHKYDLLAHVLLCAFLGIDSVPSLEASGSKAVSLRGRQGSSHGTTNYSASRRTNTEFPVLGDQSKGLVLSMEEVISGRIDLEGMIPSGDVKWISNRVLETIAIITGVPGFQVHVSPRGESPNGNIQVIEFHYTVLPAIGTTTQAVKNILSSGVASGTPQFLVVLAKRMSSADSARPHASRAPSYGLNIETPNTIELNVWRDANYGQRAIIPFATPPPSAESTPGAQPTTTAAGIFCPLAADACECATMGACIWDSGQLKCNARVSEDDRVSCSDCAAQPFCDMGSCSQLTSACACASRETCVWDEANIVCLSGAGVTSCIACPRQSTCTPPRAVAFNPPSGTLLPANEQVIQVTFDNEVRFKDLFGGRGSAKLQCVGLANSIAISRSRMTIWGRIFSVNVKSLLPTSADSTDNARSCSLIIEENLITDHHGVAYLGLESSSYDVIFRDTIAPEVLYVNPKNGEMDVELPVSITFTFSEPVVLGPAAKYLSVTLSQLEVGEAIASVTNLEMTPPVVTVAGTQLTVKLNDEVKADSHYTLSLPDGAVVDLSENKFQGLAPRTYSFWTAAGGRVSQTSATESQGLSTAAIIAVASSLAIIIAIAIWAVARYIGMRHAHKSGYVKSQSSTSNGSRQQVKPTSLDAISRSPSLRSLTTATSHRSLSRKASRESLGSNPAEKQPWTSPCEQPPTESSNRAAPAGLHRGRSSEKYKVGCTSSDRNEKASVKSAHEAAMRQQQKQSKATRNWHEAFSAARQKKQAEPRPATGAWVHTEAQQVGGRERRSAPEIPKANHQKDVPTDTPLEHPQPETASKARPPPGGASEPSPSLPETSSVPPPSQASDNKSSVPPQKSSTTTPAMPMETAPKQESELEKMSQEVLRKMRDQLDAPVAERKKVMRELLFEFHPDKSNNPYAKELCQVINEAKGWFLSET